MVGGGIRWLSITQRIAHPTVYSYNNTGGITWQDLQEKR